MSSIDFDPAIKLCLKYLHSSAPDSTEQLRLTLDDYIRQTYGSSKTLGNVLPKKYLNEEKSESVRSKHKNEKASSSKTIPIPQQSPQQIQIPERENDDSSVMDGELAFDLLEEDLTCVVCRQIAVQAGNRLVECDVCHSLYHQSFPVVEIRVGQKQTYALFCCYCAVVVDGLPQACYQRQRHGHRVAVSVVHNNAWIFWWIL
ncbi:integrator complex subunit 12 isoform X2 [Plodia interpunctella]|uniref:integrator complex subunit 12 isoform X2 n=1 Tax=Plodia interpunctella TaxID=58824 RepID=UPI00236839C4|nr:integrator complex subunit 12 isoform X2 [Plodia interpunctella]